MYHFYTSHTYSLLATLAELVNRLPFTLCRIWQPNMSEFSSFVGTDRLLNEAQSLQNLLHPNGASGHTNFLFRSETGKHNPKSLLSKREFTPRSLLYFLSWLRVMYVCDHVGYGNRISSRKSMFNKAIRGNIQECCVLWNWQIPRRT